MGGYNIPGGYPTPTPYTPPPVNRAEQQLRELERLQREEEDRRRLIGDFTPVRPQDVQLPLATTTVPPRLREMARPPATPPVQAPPAPPAPPVADTTDPLAEREAEYIRDPEAFERGRMARPPVSGELRYSVAGGPERSYNVGPNRTDVVGDPGLERFHDDKVFGREITRPARGGTLSMAADSGPDSEAYRNYLANSGRLGDEMEERARVSRAEAFAKDPFADQTAAMRRLAEQYRAQGERATAGKQYDSQLRMLEARLEMERMNAYSQIDGDASLTPEQREAAKAQTDQMIDIEKLRNGIDPKKFFDAGAGGQPVR